MDLPTFSRIALNPTTTAFYREAGSPSNPTLLLLHGYANSSLYFRDLMTLLSPHYHLLAPDMPGFGFTTITNPTHEYTFASGATFLSAFLDALHIQTFALYIFDFGAPWGLRLALQRPESVTAIISQNGNCYEDGLGKPWAALREYWRTDSEAGRDAIAARVRSFERVRAQYVDGSIGEGAVIDPAAYHLDHALLQREGELDAMQSYFWDYRLNVEMYPEFQRYLRERQPPVLAAWGKNDVSFIPPGAEAFKRDVKGAEVHLLDAGHFALAGLEAVFAALIHRFLQANLGNEGGGQR